MNGQGRIQISDTFWKVSCEHDLEATTQVEVTDFDSMTLIVKSVEA